jgi:osmotically-inducible protein OsmY
MYVNLVNKIFYFTFANIQLGLWCYVMEQETREEPAKDLYAGYYWGNDPYESYEMPGRKNDHKLKSSIIEHLRKSKKIDLDSLTILVNNGTVILTGHIRTYQKRRLIGEEVWNTPDVARLLNELKVTEPETAGPSKISEEAEQKY